MRNEVHKMPDISVMIVDNNAPQAETLRSALAKNEGIEIASVVSSRETAVKQLASKTDVVLLNPEVLKQRTLSRFIRSAQTKSPDLRVLLLLKTIPSDAELITDIKAGVRGYVKINNTPRS